MEARYKQEKDPDLRRYYRRKTSVLYVSKEFNKRSSVIGVTLPYPWEAHHLLSTNVFYKYLTLAQIKVILRSDYDINDGRNIIFLPQEPIDTPVHKLPYHSSGHTQYDKKIKREMVTLKATLDDIVKNQRDHKEAAKMIEKELHDLETIMFMYTRDVGKKPRQKLH
ncbi:AHH domain-containing protein [Pyxidicoccus xibeiensis]|uniref:AHH domain-containing protein n=1 Tax=Pyxidicoccus xibeiensis TaxID=2906759 RepID=UPI0020A6EE4F|nr:AHH domain-containing protein [Pyxidicoccus xibeiensis]MCP3143969.1 AHH domain-containing protein [Pyxidicoccus xibeiensis]